MAYKLEPQPGDRPASDAPPAGGETTFRISAEPLVENGNGVADSAEAQSHAPLPTTYGTQTLYLMARDPHSLFAYWDVDWTEAFREQMPRDRKVHLRVSRADGTEETSIEVEPMAGSCYIDVTSGDESYTADLGYYQPAGVWNSVAISIAVATPPDSIEEAEAPDFATVPFHISFQRMIDMFRVSKHENESLTTMLSDLRERAASDLTNTALTDEERDIVRAIDDAVAQSRSSAEPAAQPDRWVQQNLERILGFGARTTSPEGGLGGSSRPA